MDEDPVADLGLDQRSADARIVGAVRDHLPVPLREPPVDDRLDRRLRRVEADAVDGVALIRHDVPDDGHGGDPVLADLRLRAAGLGEEHDREGRERKRPRPSQQNRRHGVTTIVPLMSGPWIQQKYLNVPAFVNVTFHERGSGIVLSVDITGVAKKPLPCVVPS